MSTTPLRLLCTGDLAFMENVGPYDSNLPISDVGTGNVEIVISDSPGPPSEKLVHLRADEITAESYAKLGLDVVTLANNHTLDYGSGGLATTVASLERQGLRTVGAGEDVAAARAPQMANAHGNTIGFLGVTCVVPPGFAATATNPGTWAIRVRSYLETETINEQPGAAPFVHTRAEASDIDRLKLELRSLAAQVDITVLHIHWGVPPPWMTPFQGRLATYQRHLIEDLDDARPDVIIGHHPHVLHGVEWFGDTLVMYSLGHLVFQPWGRKFATSPNALILNKADQMGAAALHPPYESLEDDRNWDGCVAIVDLHADAPKGPRAVRCHVYPYEIDRESGLAFPALEARRAAGILQQLVEHTHLLSADVTVEHGGGNSRPFVTFSPPKER
jgi:hypothetical protein